jgi:hypothetical protein
MKNCNFCGAIHCSYRENYCLNDVYECVSKKSGYFSRKCWYITIRGDLDLDLMNRIKHDRKWKKDYRTKKQIMDALKSSGHLKTLAVQKLLENGLQK